MKSAAVGRFFAHCNRKSLAAANTQSRFSASNTVLLTCVIGDPPCAHILPSHRSSLQWRTFRPGDSIASAWPRAHSTVSCRHNAFFLAAPAGGRQSGVYYGIYSVFGEAERAASDAFIAPYIISERGVFCKRIFGQFPLRRLFQVGRVNLPGRWGRRRRNTDRGAAGTAFPWA